MSYITRVQSTSPPAICPSCAEHPHACATSPNTTHTHTRHACTHTPALAHLDPPTHTPMHAGRLLGQVGPVRVAFLGLAAGAAVAIVTTILLPTMNHKLGTVNVWLCGEMSFAICMIVTPWIPRAEVMWWPSIIVGAFTGVGYATHANNPYTICEDIADRYNPGGGEEHRGFANSLVNTTLTVAQIIIGAFAGLLVQATGNAHVLFALTGAIVAVASLSVLCSRSRCGMVPR